MIKYHLKGLGNEYGEDHSLTNNWDTEKDYGNEYSNVYFRIEAAGYQYPSFSFTKEDNEAFYTEVRNALEPLGWRTEDNTDEWGCIYILNGRSTLYLHPQNFNGEVLKNDVKDIAEALEKHDTFYLRWVDLFDTVWKNHKVIGYIEMTEEQKEIINGIHDVGIYIGYDRILKPEMYEKQVYRTQKYKVIRCTGRPTLLYKVIDTNGNIVKEFNCQVDATMWISRQNGI